MSECTMGCLELASANWCETCQMVRLDMEEAMRNEQRDRWSWYGGWIN